MLTGLIAACRRLHLRDTENHIVELAHLTQFRRLTQSCFPQQNFEEFLGFVRCALSLAQFGAALSIFLWSWHLGLLPIEAQHHFAIWLLSAIFLLIPLFFLLGDFLPRFLGVRYSEQAVRWMGPLALPFLALAFPVCLVSLKLLQWLLGAALFEQFSSAATQLPPEILRLIQETSSATGGLDAADRKLFEAVAQFRQRIVKEVMVPHVEVFSLPAETTIRMAAEKLEREEYSRTPVYRENIDQVIGILMWRDIQRIYMETVETGDLSLLDAPIESIIREVLYTPETKPISQLLQEFRLKQAHLAIVVNEYGATEGVITLEDILEELVGEISDEYDEQEALFMAHPQGGWILDPRMTILDVEEKLGVLIPQEGDYETVAGFIFHCAGAIPPKGFLIHRDTFDIEILKSNERVVEKVRIKPVSSPIT